MPSMFKNCLFVLDVSMDMPCSKKTSFYSKDDYLKSQQFILPGLYLSFKHNRQEYQNQKTYHGNLLLVSIYIFS